MAEIEWFNAQKAYFAMLASLTEASMSELRVYILTFFMSNDTINLLQG